MNYNEEPIITKDNFKEFGYCCYDIKNLILAWKKEYYDPEEARETIGNIIIFSKDKDEPIFKRKNVISVETTLKYEDNPDNYWIDFNIKYFCHCVGNEKIIIDKNNSILERGLVFDHYENTDGSVDRTPYSSTAVKIPKHNLYFSTNTNEGNNLAFHVYKDTVFIVNDNGRILYLYTDKEERFIKPTYLICEFRSKIEEQNAVDVINEKYLRIKVGNHYKFIDMEKKKRKILPVKGNITKVSFDHLNTKINEFTRTITMENS